MGFLPSGDLILVSLKFQDKEYYGFEYCKIYCYSVKNKPKTNTTFWKCSQIHNIKLTESLGHSFHHCLIYQTKLFFLNTYRQMMFQLNLLTMTFDMQYFFDYIDKGGNDKIEVVINKNQTLLTLDIRKNSIMGNVVFYVFLMETGTLISKYG